ncbi:hypothetical protein CRG98_012788 [Punica granatum]|uniref:Uncharacterized protein n=1 Tax=Punica granatum TaxID=22663 RepID=A0A2I0KE54_PUNGR|nr:hypothetical protein CRG98_012788 [Punica granatum]
MDLKRPPQTRAGWKRSRPTHGGVAETPLTRFRLIFALIRGSGTVAGPRAFGQHWPSLLDLWGPVPVLVSRVFFKIKATKD